MNLDKINPKFLELPVDYLYHLGIDSTWNLEELFKNVQFAIFTHGYDDAARIAHIFAKEFYKIQEDNFSFAPLYKTERFHFYKIGIAIIVSAGIGMPSTLICLNEITKLFVHAKINNPIFCYLGQSGGLGSPVGTLVINDKAFNSKLEAKFTSIECGIAHDYPTTIDNKLNSALLDYAINHTNYNVSLGSSIGAYDYYDEQARMDGFLELGYTKQEQIEYLNKAKTIGVKAINMESLAFIGFCNQLEIATMVINMVMNNRLISDDILIDISEQNKILDNAARLYAGFIIKCCRNA